MGGGDESKEVNYVTWRGGPYHLGFTNEQQKHYAEAKKAMEKAMVLCFVGWFLSQKTLTRQGYIYQCTCMT